MATAWGTPRWWLQFIAYQEKCSLYCLDFVNKYRYLVIEKKMYVVL